MTQKAVAKAVYTCDPRSRLAVVLCLSTLSVLIDDMRWLAAVFAAAVLCCCLFRAPFRTVARQFRWLLPMFVMLALAQSLFGTADTEIWLHLGRVHLLTAYGVQAAVLFSLRILIVVVSACILLPESTRRMIQALSQMHLPYELVFMVSTAVRFMGLVRDEFRNSMHAIQMRGVDMKRIPLNKRMQVYSYLMLPVISSTLSRARQLSLSLELRGFRRSKERSSYFTLQMRPRDWLIVAFAFAVAAAALYAYFRYGKN